MIYELEDSGSRPNLISQKREWLEQRPKRSQDGVPNVSCQYLGDLEMNWWLAGVQLGIEKDGDFSVKTSHSIHLRYHYFEVHYECHQQRAVEYAIRNLERDPWGKGLSGKAGSRGQTESWMLYVQCHFQET